ncbi:glycosyltransferase family 4 protein [Mucilaginibacter glaciei]|uniref:Glycosyltransferase family 4 protein n=1 Tax=Mucilaginibacter glaciei TaxID=2772109 RepID=A0A926P144_9SPHI|nr:glycosyltransferase family 1 protein [Mucilaginibacter glaciei]MBD1395404.1 glycosyltransferase family 4 protein [Mucilaginibacter glaciei]
MESNQKKIRLGIDAKWYFDGPPSGHMVVKNLVDQMVTRHDEFELCLFLCSKHKNLAKSHFPQGIELIFLPNVPNMIANMFVVPYFANAHKLDAVMLQNFLGPWSDKLFKVVYIHDVLFLDYPEYFTKNELKYFNFIRRYAIKANLVITISETEKKRMVQNYVARSAKISVVHHGIDEKFKPLCNCQAAIVQTVKEKYNLPDRYLLFVGRINIRKNLDNLIKALGMLIDSDVKLVVVGERTALNLKLEEMIAAEQLGGRVIFTGHVPEEDLYTVYANATVFCFPSYAEGFGLPPLEAMRCGVPVVVSDRTAMPEVCGDAALYANPDDAEDIARKIRVLLNDHSFYLKKADEGIAQSEKYSWKKSADDILNLISHGYDHSKSYR